jgi:hypothetical protein
MLIVSNLVILPLNNYYSSPNRISQPDYKGAYSYIFDSYGQGELIFSVSSGSIPRYYVGNISCNNIFGFYNFEDSSFDSYREWVNTSLSLWTHEINGELYDIYNGCRVIRNSEEFGEVANYPYGIWFAIEKSSYLPIDLRNKVFDKCSVKEFYKIKVYYCDNASLL